VQTLGRLLEAMLEVTQVLGDLTLRDARTLRDFMSRELFGAQHLGDAPPHRLHGGRS
jgi:hypothetical protein